MQRVLDVRTEHEHRHTVELLEHRERDEQDDHDATARAQALAHGHEFAADPGQEIVGQEHLVVGVLLESVLLLVEDDGGQTGESRVGELGLDVVAFGHGFLAVLR